MMGLDEEYSTIDRYAGFAMVIISDGMLKLCMQMNLERKWAGAV
jgi:hypothetical protein